MNIPNYFLAVGSCANWQSAFSKGNVWGLSENRYSCWRRLKTGDVLFFYLEVPIRAVVGYGTVLGKFHDLAPFFAADWGQKTEWPWRISFGIQWPPEHPLRGTRISLDGLGRRVALKRGFQGLSWPHAEKLLQRCIQSER